MLHVTQQQPLIVREFSAVTTVDFCPTLPHDYAVTSGSRVSKLLQRLQVAFSRISGSDLQQRHQLGEEDHISFQGDCLQCSVSSRWSATPNREWGGCSQTVWPQQQIDPQTIHWSLQRVNLAKRFVPIHGFLTLEHTDVVLLLSVETTTLWYSVDLLCVRWPSSMTMVTWQHNSRHCNAQL